jgi:hypothetical protein
MYRGAVSSMMKIIKLPRVIKVLLQPLLEGSSCTWLFVETELTTTVIVVHGFGSHRLNKLIPLSMQKTAGE